MKVVKFIVFWIISALFVILAFNLVKTIFAKGFAGEFIGAFFGAFFAAISVVMYEIFLKYRDKEIKRVNNLILYELELNSCMRIISDLLYQIKKRIEQKDSDRVAIIHHLSLEQLNISFEPIISIRHMGIANELISLHSDFCKINSDLQGLMLVYNSNIQMVTSSPEDKQIKVLHIKNLNNELKKQLEYFIGFLEETENEVIGCVAGIRIIVKWDKPSLAKHIYRYFTGWGYDEKRFANEIGPQKEKILKEIEEVQKESGKKIEKAKKETFEA